MLLVLLSIRYAVRPRSVLILAMTNLNSIPIEFLWDTLDPSKRGEILGIGLGWLSRRTTWGCSPKICHPAHDK